MDQHILPGVKSKDVAEAHLRDLLFQKEHGCKCMTYWIDEKRGNVFCLIEAPEKESVEDLHKNAHGLVPNRIIEVNDVLVQSFLGRISDPEEAEVTDGLKVFSDPSFRILLVTHTADPLLLRYKLGIDVANEMITQHNVVMKEQLSVYGGREVELEGSAFVASFTSANKAVACAQAIQAAMHDTGLDQLSTKIAVHGGQPVAGSDKLFGDTLRLAGYMCNMSSKSGIVISSTVRDIILKDQPPQQQKNTRALSTQDEILLDTMYRKLADNWRDDSFNVAQYCRELAMSKSQLYRLSIALSGFPPNALLKDYRLEKAKELMKKKSYNISQVTFDCGFTSPSYFTKCFKKKYGLLPMTYLELLS